MDMGQAGNCGPAEGIVRLCADGAGGHVGRAIPVRKRQTVWGSSGSAVWGSLGSGSDTEEMGGFAAQIGGQGGE
jgi:hypothetical protein